MSRLVWTSNTPFDISNWADKEITKIVAGNNCVMALTASGQALQKIENHDLAIREKYWHSLKDIALSKSFEGLAIGLMQDGSCMISKRPLRYYLSDQPNKNFEFDRINNAVRSWKDIVQVACTETFFALDIHGHVHYVSLFSGSDDYREILQWRDVVRIIPSATQCGIFGITKDGQILCAGHNLVHGPHGNIQRQLAQLHDVVAVGTAGSECEKILVAFRNGTLQDHNKRILDVHCATDGQILEGDLHGILIRNQNGGLNAVPPKFCDRWEKISTWNNVRAMAVGNRSFEAPFALALLD